MWLPDLPRLYGGRLKALYLCRWRHFWWLFLFGCINAFYSRYGGYCRLSDFKVAMHIREEREKMDRPKNVVPLFQ